MSSCGGSNGVLRAVRSPIRGATTGATVSQKRRRSTTSWPPFGTGRAQQSRHRGPGLAEMGKPGPRWDGADPATLERILFHLVQEYARHLDIVAELANGQIEE
jgi:hypothetical protein